MSAAKSFVVHGVKFPSGDFIAELQNANLSIGSDDLTGHAAGHVYPLFTGTRGQKPELTFSCHNIATILAGLGLLGTDLSAGNTELYCKKITDLGSRLADATAEHVVFRLATAFGCWTRISAQHGQDATIDVRILPQWNGSTLPLIPVGSVALSGTPAASEWFTLGPVKVNGTFLAGVTGWTLDLGISTIELAADGDLYLTFAATKEVSPVLTIQGLSADDLVTYGVLGTALSSLSLFLRKRAADGGNEADGTSAHVKITATNGIIRADGVSGNGNDPSAQNLVIRPRSSSGSAAVLTLATGQAIS